MNQEVKKLWVDALRSGEFQQTTCSLARTSIVNGARCYCALGVLCEVYRRVNPDGLNIDWTYHVHSIDSGHWSFDGEVEGLPESVMKWAEEPRLNNAILVLEHGNHAFIATLNDDFEYSFSHIADMIDAQL